MKTYRHGQYKLTLKETDKRMSTGQIRVEYHLMDSKGIIFSGDDFGCSPMNAPESKESADALLSFLTLREGDTDSEYFDGYTPRQIEFRDNEAEDLYLWREKLNPEAFK